MPWSGVPESDLHIQPSCNACPSHSSTFLHLALTSTLQHTCMKRKAEWANPWERCRKIQVPPAWPAGCPYCSKTHLSWDEWGCYCTILQDDESENMYWSCRSCMRVTMQKQYQFMKWWRWGGEGDPQEQLATSSRIPISACEAMNTAIMSRHAPLSRSHIGTQTWSQLCALLFSNCFAVTMDCVLVVEHMCL